MIKSKTAKAGDWLAVFLCVLMIFICLLPLLNILARSLSSPQAVGAGEVFLLPKGFNIDGYRRVFLDPNIMTGYKNTLYYTVAGTSLNLILTLPCGYALSKGNLPGNKIFMGLFMFTMYFSGGIIPSFLLIRNLGLYNTRLVLIILGAVSVYNVIICRTFFAGIPKELEEAAYIDGASVNLVFFRIILPLSKALIGVMVLYYAVGHWNAYFSAMMYTIDQQIQPLQLVLRRILILDAMNEKMNEMEDAVHEAYNTKQLVKFAVIVVSSLPVLIMYPFLQKYFDKGVMIGSIKG